MMGQLGEHFSQQPRPDTGKLVRVELEKSQPEPLETEELKQKFHRRLGEEFYEKLTAVDHPRPPFGPIEHDWSVQLKPSHVVKRDLPKEDMESVKI